MPKSPAIPAANPPTIPVTKMSKTAFPPSGNSTAIFSARIKSLALLNNHAYTIQNTAIAKNGTTKAEAFLKRTIAPDKKAANMMDHHGNNSEKTSASTKVNKKLDKKLFIVLELKFE